MTKDSSGPHRFAIALSFPGEQRDFVEQVAGHLAAAFGKDRVLYDKYYEAEFARLKADARITDYLVLFAARRTRDVLLAQHP